MFTDRDNFYIHGFRELNIATQEPSFLKIMQTLQSLAADQQREGFSWESKYPGTEDFRPSVYAYDECFMEFLIDNDILNQLKKLTGYHYELYHIQVRRVSAHSDRHTQDGAISYMDWHRDSYIHGDTILGKFPPPIKLIFYPALGEEPGPRLKVIPNSHTIQLHADQDYASTFGAPINSLDRQLIAGMQPAIIESSDDTMLLFNTALLHGAATNAGIDGVLRVVYAFVLEDQFDDPGIHTDTRDAFREMHQGA